ncbi:MAG TPA: hypothetical protein VNZ25_07505 [Candidatus Angelobacter sp.]|jgi:hypothetical protein|nr:hypothetical protein [Candidatus Angelobacter sp.]
MNQNRKPGRLKDAICAIAALFLGTVSASAIAAYLPIVGPPPLRIELFTTNIFNYSQFKLDLANRHPIKPAPQASTNNPSTASQAITSPPPPATTAASASGTSGNSEENMAGGENRPTPRENFNFPSSTASDLLTVTPQMIAQYLKPDPTATNSLDRPGAVVFVPADLPFTPPTPKGNSESQANYHSP